MHADIEAAWQTVIEGWENPARHELFMGLVAKHSEFSWAASKYKERAGDAIADKQLERVRKAATASLLATAAKKPEGTPYKRTIVIFMVLLLLIILALVGLMLVHDARPRSSAPPIPKPARH